MYWYCNKAILICKTIGSQSRVNFVCFPTVSIIVKIHVICYILVHFYSTKWNDGYNETEIKQQKNIFPLVSYYIGSICRMIYKSHPCDIYPFNWYNWLNVHRIPHPTEHSVILYITIVTCMKLMLINGRVFINGMAAVAIWHVAGDNSDLHVTPIQQTSAHHTYFVSVYNPHDRGPNVTLIRKEM